MNYRRMEFNTSLTMFRKADKTMAIDITAVAEKDEVWLITLNVREGVYKKEGYSVRVIDVPLAADTMSRESQEQHMKTFVLEQVTAHMRRGSLPPTGMQIDGRKVWNPNASTVS